MFCTVSAENAAWPALPCVAVLLLSYSVRELLVADNKDGFPVLPSVILLGQEPYRCIKQSMGSQHSHCYPLPPLLLPQQPGCSGSSVSLVSASCHAPWGGAAEWDWVRAAHVLGGQSAHSGHMAGRSQVAHAAHEKNRSWATLLQMSMWLGWKWVLCVVGRSSAACHVVGWSCTYSRHAQLGGVYMWLEGKQVAGLPAHMAEKNPGGRVLFCGPHGMWPMAAQKLALI